MAKAAEYDETIIIKMLANPRRRIFLKALASNGESCSLNSLVDEVMRIEDSEWDDASKYRNSVRVSLRQNHIETLEKYDFVEYDPDADIIKRGTEFYKINSTLDSFDRESSDPEFGASAEPPQTFTFESSADDKGGRSYSRSLVVAALLFFLVAVALYFFF
ncbi:hypothetical protein [Halostagnicola sp. A-GB9-2]|uniref:DUF7344 domain-containing protein n=1 Tax=Halostagnicola sp. A-GB9-2 TaxID=3048066 RepID=UPI0024C0D029|nr:hypothetical protein [Halostagnicola sp. A-GB9-2]MDJ1434292.1 hypothetical protein [Halostagnicola sp. A-GB9-2]